MTEPPIYSFANAICVFAEQKTTSSSAGKEDRIEKDERKTAVVPTEEPSTAPIAHQEEAKTSLFPFHRIPESPKFSGAKRIVVLHSGPNETTIRENSLLPESETSSQEKLGESNCGDTEEFLQLKQRPTSWNEAESKQ